jgi:hypothetical protein
MSHKRAPQAGGFDRSDAAYRKWPEYKKTGAAFAAEAQAYADRPVGTGISKMLPCCPVIGKATQLY